MAFELYGCQMANRDDVGRKFPTAVLEGERAKVVVTLGYEVMSRCTITSHGSDGEMRYVLEWWDVDVPRMVDKAIGKEYYFKVKLNRRVHEMTYSMDKLHRR